MCPWGENLKRSRIVPRKRRQEEGSGTPQGESYEEGKKGRIGGKAGAQAESS